MKLSMDNRNVEQLHMEKRQTQKSAMEKPTRKNSILRNSTVRNSTWRTRHGETRAENRLLRLVTLRGLICLSATVSLFDHAYLVCVRCHCRHPSLLTALPSASSSLSIRLLFSTTQGFFVETKLTCLWRIAASTNQHNSRWVIPQLPARVPAPKAGGVAM